jgi:hypothetical protein
MASEHQLIAFMMDEDEATETRVEQGFPCHLVCGIGHRLWPKSRLGADISAKSLKAAGLEHSSGYPWKCRPRVYKQTLAKVELDCWVGAGLLVFMEKSHILSKRI